jgi:hypothetical protein
MDPLSLILGALVSGAASAVADSATDAVKTAYASLKSLVKTRLGGDAGTVDKYEEKPEVWRPPLEDALKMSGAAEDAGVVAAAQRLMELVDPDGAAAGKYAVVNRGPVYGQTIGDRNVITQTFGAGGGAVPESPKAP